MKGAFNHIYHLYFLGDFRDIKVTDVVLDHKLAEAAAFEALRLHLHVYD